MLKFAIILTLLAFYARTQTIPNSKLSLNDVKQELIQRAVQLKTRVNQEIQKLVQQNRQHLSQLLREEGERVENLVNQLNKVSDQEQLAFAESQLIDAEYRVDDEINILQRETATQEFLVSAANTLREWLSLEIKKLRKEESSRAQKTVRLLESEEEKLNKIVHQLVNAKDQKTIETLEVELRFLEATIYDYLRQLHFQPPTEPPVNMTTQKVTSHSSRVPTTVRITTPSTPTRKSSTQTRTRTTKTSTTRTPTTRTPTTRTSTTRAQTTRSASLTHTTLRHSKPAQTTTSVPEIRGQKLKIRITSLIERIDKVLKDVKNVGSEVESLKIDQYELLLTLKELQNPALSNAAIDLLMKQFDKIEGNIEKVIRQSRVSSTRKPLK